VARKRLLSRLIPGKFRKTKPKKSKPKRKTSTARRRSATERVDVTRQEYNEIVTILDRRGEVIEGLRRELETQFKRMAQIQSELDEVRQAWLKNKN
jgi:hypothetical protein